METFEQIITILTPLLLILLSSFLLPKLKKIASTSQSKTLEIFADWATAYVETKTKDVQSTSGKEKMEMALSWLESTCKANGIPYNKEICMAIIEKMVQGKNLTGIFSHSEDTKRQQALMELTNELMKNIDLAAKKNGVALNQEQLSELIRKLGSSIAFQDPTKPSTENQKLEITNPTTPN